VQAILLATPLACTHQTVRCGISAKADEKNTKDAIRTMNVSFYRRKYVFGLLIATGIAVSGMICFGGQSKSAAYCFDPKYHQFDFWVGNWDVFEFGNPTKVAHARIDSILGGCVLREEYDGADGHQGQSFSIYDAMRKVWHQTWVTNRGELLQVEGRIEHGQMVLRGTNLNGALVRGTWTPIKGEVRETAVSSKDGGNSWQPWFDLMFRPSITNMPAKTASAENDEKSDWAILTALDKRYQAAVKQNDAATMDLILADDFTLVTGAGKRYTKADLLAEARSGRIHYDVQDDQDRSVRVWGDTAVITARLIEEGNENGKPFEKSAWFSDTYIRTPAGWRYAFGQSSLPLTQNPK
jgi:Domain of unknown function (DUF4440)